MRAYELAQHLIGCSTQKSSPAPLLSNNNVGPAVGCSGGRSEGVRVGELAPLLSCHATV